MAVALQAVLPKEEPRALVANARSAAEFAVVEQAHAARALADCSAGLPEDDSVPAGVPAALSAVGSVPAYLARAGLVVLMAHDSIPADCSQQADPNVQHCSPDARPVH